MRGRGRRFRPRDAGRAARGRARGPRRATRSRSSPSPPTSGCFSSASNGDRREALGGGAGDGEQQGAAGHCESGRPALSSASIPQRASSADTRAASMRSGVTSAAVCPGVSTASRSASAIAVRFRRRIGEFDGADAGQAALGRRQAAPFVAEVGGGHGMGDGAPADRRRRRAGPRRHVWTSPRAIAEAIEQQLQVILRMARLAAALLVRARALPIPRRAWCRRAPGPAGRPCLRAAGRPRRSNCRDGRCGGGDAGGDGETGRRLLLPAPRRRPQQEVAALGEVDQAAPLQFRRPKIDDRPQPFQRHLPVSRQTRDRRRRCPQGGTARLPRSSARRACARGRRQPARPRRHFRLRRGPKPPARARAPRARSPAAPAPRRRRDRARRRCDRRGRGRRSAIRRGRTRPPPLARTKASVRVRTARLLGSRTRPPARASGSRPKSRASSRRPANPRS